LGPHREIDVTTLLQLLAPYGAVLVFWCWARNGWLTILAYHAQVLFWAWRSRPSLPSLEDKSSWRSLQFVAPSIVSGPVLYVLIPWIECIPLADWLQSYQLTGVSLLLMIPYFGLVNPVMEQIHWAPLHQRTWFAPLFFAGYHLLVLQSLVGPLWMALAFLGLTAVSVFWQWLRETYGGLSAAILSHMLADLGIVLAGWWRS
jgi:hypothetical protein